MTEVFDWRTAAVPEQRLPLCSRVGKGLRVKSLVIKYHPTTATVQLHVVVILCTIFLPPLARAGGRGEVVVVVVVVVVVASSLQSLPSFHETLV